jgi:hypothetical protein
MAAEAARPFRLRRREWARRKMDRLTGLVPLDEPDASELPDPHAAASVPTLVWAGYLAMVVGAVAVCIAFAMSRSGTAGAAVVYWSGQFVMVLAGIAVCLPRRATAGERLTAVMLLSALQCLLTWAYSPELFRFPDELQHARTAHDIVISGHLFTPNAALPVSPGFPGLEIVTSAVSKLAGVSVFAAGVITASVSHVVLVAAVFAWARAVGFTARTASVATLVYGFAPGYPYFDTLFTYTAIALPFFALAARAAVRNVTIRDLALWVLPPLFVTVVSHHLTAYLTVVVVGLIGVLSLAVGRKAHGWSLLAITAIGAAAAAAWTAAFSPAALEYLVTPTKVAIANLFSRSSGLAGDVAVRGVPPPTWQQYLAYGATVVMIGLTLLAAAAVWRARWSGWRRYLGLCALLYPAAVGVRLVAADGPELFSRLMPYPMLLVCLPVAAVLCGWWDRRGRAGMSLSLGAIAVVALGMQAVSLPPSWERLPAGFHVAAFNSGIDGQVKAAAKYARGTLPSGSRIACDVTMCSLVSGYAHVNTTNNPSAVFYANTVAARRIELSELGIDAVIVDSRIARQPPFTGFYFVGQSQYDQSNKIYPSRLLANFAADPRLGRVYDNGAIQMYDTRAVAGG